MPALHAEPTPNPNSVKITTDSGSFIDDGMVALSSSDDADTHPLGQLLFAIEDVTDVLILPQFVTVSKRDGADWEAVLPHVKQILGEYLRNTRA